MRDEVFLTAEPVRDFTFDATVAAVFDDMLERSVPLYREVQRMVVELALGFLEGEAGVVYDVGCSTGNTLAALAERVEPSRAIHFIGLEPSADMRQAAFRKFAMVPGSERLDILSDSAEDIDALPGARVITILYTLQFVRPVHRLKTLATCYESLQPGGCLMLAEKTLAEDSRLRRRFIDLYHDFKRRSGYSAMEIARKREALENVLIPFTRSENVSLLRSAGFSTVETVFQWYNFALFLAVK